MGARIALFRKYLPLLHQLVERDFKLKYRRSFLGYAWSLLNPLFNMLVMTAVFSNVFRFKIEHYPVYYLLGATVMNVFTEATNKSLSSVFENGVLIRKVYIPKYIFPLASTLFAMVNCFISLGAVVIVMLITRTPLPIQIVSLPLLAIYVFLFTLGIGLILSAVSVYFRDITHIYGVVLTALTYLTPVFYPIEALPEWVANIVRLNPLFHLVFYFRNIALYGVWPSLTENLICLVTGLVTLAIGLVVFFKAQKNFIIYI